VADGLRLGLHLLEAGVVVGELVQVGASDLRCHPLVVVGHVRGWIVESMLQLDVHTGSELLDVEG